jgi:hypothetical protein
MTKNIFEEANLQRISLFDTFKTNQTSKAKQTNENTNTSGHKNSKKSNNSDSFRDKNKDPTTLKEVHETSGKKPFYVNNQNSPSMYKIALRIKKLTEYKLKKTQSVPVNVAKDDDQSKEAKAGTVTATTTSETIKETNNKASMIKEHDEEEKPNQKNPKMVEEAANSNDNHESLISDTVEFELGDHGISEVSSK